MAAARWQAAAFCGLTWGAAMRLVVNGKEIDFRDGATIADFLREKGMQETLVAVEHNYSWLRREDWSSVSLNVGDRLEIVKIMAGG
jgi:thiamine biosynthesis protein ThiS